MASTRLAATWPAAIIAACCVLFQAGPAAADDVPSGCKPPPEKVAVDTTPPINIGILANALIYYRCTDYDADVTAALGAARDWVGKRAPEVAKPAIVLDIDETSLSNWEEIFRMTSAIFHTAPVISMRNPPVANMLGSSARERSRSSRRWNCSTSPRP